MVARSEATCGAGIVGLIRQGIKKMNDENELMAIMDKMVDIIDRLEDLPKECPDIVKSETYQTMSSETKELMSYLQNRTKEMLEMADNLELNKGFQTIFGNVSGDN